MPATHPRDGKEEFATRGDALYETKIRSRVEAGNDGKFVPIDIETGEYEIDADAMAATDRLIDRVSDAQTWLVRVGSPYVRRLPRLT